MTIINESKDESHREEYRIRYVPNSIKQEDGSFKHGFMVQGRTVNHPRFGSSVWENIRPHETLDQAKSYVNGEIKKDKSGKSHYLSHNEGGPHDGNLRGLGEEYNGNTINESKNLIDFSQARNATDFVNSVNNILAAKVSSKLDAMRPRVASDMFKGGYLPKSGDEQEFEDKHTINVIDYPVKNENGLPFRDTSIPERTNRQQMPASYNRGEDAHVNS